MTEDLKQVRTVIDDLIKDTPDMIHDMISNLLSCSGKMLRPMMVVLAGRYGDFEAEKIYSLAAAVELLHNATLVHDDIIDDAALRRGLPAIHTIHGSKLAILVGDYLFSTCFVLAAKNSKIQHYDSLAQAVARICEGEILQDTGKFVFDPSVRNYKRRIASKTAVLFSLSLYLGAKESGCSETVCSVFIRIGYNVGMAFQIIDDILDFTGDPKKIGKPAFGHDLSEGIYTLPLILALKDGDAQLEKMMRRQSLSRRRRKKIVGIVSISRGMEDARGAAALYSERALREIGRLDDGYTKDQLLSLTSRLVSREY
ncbi:MAG: polyprenyl synthetase family protein [Spirochaetales bacterium]|nr:polyprenyl synthetase family protein [Spirochaetales bacterium]